MGTSLKSLVRGSRNREASMHKKVSTALVTALAATAVGGLGIIGTASSAEAYSCSGQPYQTHGNAAVTGVFSSGGSRIRSGPSTNCGALGVGYSSQSARLDCYVYNQSDGYFYDHVKDTTTGISGWTREDVLNTVSYVACSPLYV
jgi:hypothetical protein